MSKTFNGAKDPFGRLPFRIHPRVFAALGADLVTNDVVAVIELVKNAYDAFAENVWIRFHEDRSNGVNLEILDDGDGMTKDIIENVWSLVATPYKEQNPIVKNGEKVRRVVGEKGLGRLSVARLGDRLRILTQARGAPCYELIVNWTDISSGNDLSNSFARYREFTENSPFVKSGTQISIFGLHGQWDENRILDLQENLARLISPFSMLGEFNIYLSGISGDQSEEVKIESPDFLSKPKYCIQGDVDKNGSITAKYIFRAITNDTTREKKVKHQWGEIYEDILNRESQPQYPYSSGHAHCGAFSFEIRAWDISSDDTQEIAEHFEFNQHKVRKAIRSFNFYYQV